MVGMATDRCQAPAKGGRRLRFGYVSDLSGGLSDLKGLVASLVTGLGVGKTEAVPPT